MAADEDEQVADVAAATRQGTAPNGAPPGTSSGPARSWLASLPDSVLLGLDEEVLDGWQVG